MIMKLVEQKKEDVYERLEKDITEIVANDSQIDPQFKTDRCYVKISTSYIYKELVH
jgi:hypothetical protein